MQQFYKKLDNVLRKNYYLEENSAFYNNRDYINQFCNDVNQLENLFNRYEKYDVTILKNIVEHLYDNQSFTIIFSQKFIFSVFQNIIWQEPNNKIYYLLFAEYMSLFSIDWEEQINEIKKYITTDELEKAYDLAMSIQSYADWK